MQIGKDRELDVSDGETMVVWGMIVYSGDG